MKKEATRFSEDFVNMPIYRLNMNTRLFRTVNSSVTLFLLFSTRVHFGGKKRDKYFLVTNRKVISNSVSRCISLYCVISVRFWTVVEENVDFITKSIFTSKHNYLISN